MRYELPRLNHLLCCQAACDPVRADELIDIARHGDTDHPTTIMARSLVSDALVMRELWRLTEPVTVSKAERPQHGFYFVVRDESDGAFSDCDARYCGECDSIYCNDPVRHFAAGFIPRSERGKVALSAVTVEVG